MRTFGSALNGTSRLNAPSTYVFSLRILIFLSFLLDVISLRWKYSLRALLMQIKCSDLLARSILTPSKLGF